MVLTENRILQIPHNTDYGRILIMCISPKSDLQHSMVYKLTSGIQLFHNKLSQVIHLTDLISSNILEYNHDDHWYF